MRMTSTWAVSFVRHQHRLPDRPPSRLEYDTKDRDRDAHGYAHENEKTEPPLPQQQQEAHANDDVKT